MTSVSVVTASTASKLSNSRVQIDTSTASTSLGRGVAVPIAIPAGSLLLRLDPLISVLDDTLLDKACSSCFALSKTVDDTSGKELLKCTGCGFLRYCSKACQKKDWKAHHSRECKYLQLNANTPPILLRGVMRLVNLYAGDEKNLTFAEDVSKLLSHMEQIEKSERWEAVEQISEGIGRITTAGGGRPLSPDGIRGIQQLICKFMINSITLVSATFDQLGMTFDPTLALLNHSCNPNAAVVFERNFASVRSIRDIGPNEQVTISYVDNTFKRATRRRQLRDQYFFQCRCIGCEPPDHKFTSRDSWICEKKTCKALIPEPLLTGSFTCPECHTEQSTSLDGLRSLETRALTVLESLSNSTSNSNLLMNDILLPTLASLTSCPSWPPIRQPAPALRRQIYQLALDLGNYEAAYHHSNTLSTPPLSNLHPESFHPLRTVQLFTTASLIALLAAQENSVDYLKRAWELLKVVWNLCKGSHGENSEFAKRVAAKRGEVETDLSLGGEEIRQWMRTNA